MNKQTTINKAKEKLEYYRGLSRSKNTERIKVDKNDGLVRRFLNRINQN